MDAVGGWSWRAVSLASMGQRCPHCGLPVDQESANEPIEPSVGGELLDGSDTDLIEFEPGRDANEPARGRAETPVSSDSVTSGGQARWIVFGAVAALFLVVVGIGRLTGGEPVDQARDEAAADDGEPLDDDAAAIADDEAAEDASDGSSGADGDADGPGQGAVFDPPTDDHLLFDEVKDLFGGRVNGEGRTYSVVYRHDDGLRTMNATGLGEALIFPGGAWNDSIELPLISDGRQTWAVDPVDPTRAFLVSNRFEVVSVGSPGVVAYIDHDAGLFGLNWFGATEFPVELPPGTDVLPVEGQGLMLLPSTGGTFRQTPSGYEFLSDDHLVAGGSGGLIYRRCDEQLSCDLYASAGEESEQLLAVPASSRLELSPDARWLLVVPAEGGTMVVDLRDGGAWSVTEAPTAPSDEGDVDGEAAAEGDPDVDAAAAAETDSGSDDAVGGDADAGEEIGFTDAYWAPDSSFVVWISGRTIQFAFPEEERTESIAIPNGDEAVSSLIVTRAEVVTSR